MYLIRVLELARTEVVIIIIFFDFFFFLGGGGHWLARMRVPLPSPCQHARALARLRAIEQTVGKTVPEINLSCLLPIGPCRQSASIHVFN